MGSLLPGGAGNARRANWPATNVTSGAATCSEHSSSVQRRSCTTRPSTQVLKTAPRTSCTPHCDPLRGRSRAVHAKIAIMPTRPLRILPVGDRVLLRAPRRADMGAFVAAAHASRRLHGAWVVAPQTRAAFETYVTR